MKQAAEPVLRVAEVAASAPSWTRALTCSCTFPSMLELINFEQYKKYFTNRSPKMNKLKTQYHWVDFPGYARYFFQPCKTSPVKNIGYPSSSQGTAQQPEVIFIKTSGPVLWSYARAVPNQNRSHIIPDTSQSPESTKKVMEMSRDKKQTNEDRHSISFPLPL